MSRIFRYEVPVDDGWHSISCGPVLHVASRQFGVVEFWATPTGPEREFIVVGTGHEWSEDEASYVGTALAGPLVWHLLERM